MVLKYVTADMKVAREETFAPLAPVFRFETTDEVIQQAQRHNKHEVPVLQGFSRRTSLRVEIGQVDAGIDTDQERERQPVQADGHRPVASRSVLPVHPGSSVRRAVGRHKHTGTAVSAKESITVPVGGVLGQQ